MKFPEPQLRKARIEIVPMIDTIFFLLVFFMVATLSSVKMQGLRLNVPKDNGPPAVSRKAKERLTLSVAPDGRYYLNARAVAPAEMPAMLTRELAAHPNAPVVVNVAPTQKTQTLISVMDVVNETLTRAGSSAPIVVATERAQIGNNAGEHEAKHVER